MISALYDHSGGGEVELKVATFGLEGGQLRYLAKVANKGNLYVGVFAGDSDGNIFQNVPFSHIAELRSALNTFTPENVLLHGLAEGDAWIKYA